MMATNYNKFNENQKRAITFDDDIPVLVIAGAGSGKTSVLTHRVVYLINEKNYYSERILGFTFTNKAANEMKTRISNIIPNKKFQYIGTFHSICLRILREDIKALNIENITSNFSIIDDDDQNSILKDIYKVNNFDNQVLKIKVCLSWISKMKSENIYENDEVYEWLSFLDNTYDGNKKKDICKKVYEEYLKFLKNSNLLDFDDLIKYAKQVLKIEEIGQKWKNRFDYILVDEFQDTNLDQYEVIKLLSKNMKNVFAVGDPDQMIYSWRGAQKDIFNLFKNDFTDTEIIVLEQNYRSTKKILNIANSLINNNPNRIKKNLFTDSNFDSEVVYFESEDQDSESRFVCSKIKELVNEKKYQYKNIAVLYRANYLSRNIEESLSYNHIPYRVYGGFRFYQRKEIKDIIAYMRLVANSDEMSLTRIYNFPKRQISEKTFFVIKNYAVENNLSTFASFGKADEIDELSTKAKQACLEFYNLISEIRNKKFDSISQLIDEITDKTNYFQMLKEEGEENRIENINELKNAAIDFEKNNPENANLNHYLQELAILTSIDDNDDKNNKDTVSLMTVHTAKGLEFDIIFIIQMNENVFPSTKAIEEGNLDEERRIAYVAITRAKKNLYLSCSSGTTFFGNVSVKKTPSRFLIEIDNLLADKRILTKNTSFNNKKIFESHEKENKEIDLDNVYHTEKEEYYIGDLILHDKFGKGIVLDVQSSTITIAFEKPQFGKKILIKHHKAIRKIKN